MKVKMLVSMAGGVTLSPGDIHECDAAEAKRLIEAGSAIPHADERKQRAVNPRIAEQRG